MKSDFTEIAEGMLKELGEKGRVDIRRWILIYPDLAAEIVDAAACLSEPPASYDPDRTWDDVEGALHMVMSQLCVSALSHPSQGLAGAIRSVRDKPVPTLKGKRAAPSQFKRAAVYAWAASELGKRRPRVTRLATQKAVYVLEHALGLGIFTQHAEMQLGPYDSKARYVDAEPIAKNKGWISVTEAEIVAGGNIAEAVRYAARYTKSHQLAAQILGILGSYSDPQLEALTTTLAIIRRDRSANVSAEQIINAIDGIPKWRPKLTKANFTVRAVQEAIERLSNLALIPESSSAGHWSGDNGE